MILLADYHHHGEKNDRKTIGLTESCVLIVSIPHLLLHQDSVDTGALLALADLAWPGVRQTPEEQPLKGALGCCPLSLGTTAVNHGSLMVDVDSGGTR